MLLWVTATPFPLHLPVPIGCPGLCHPMTAGSTDAPGTLGSSHIRQSQLGSFTTTKFIPEDPLHGTISSHHRELHSHPRTSSPRAGRSHMVVHELAGLGAATFTQDSSGAGSPEDAPALLSGKSLQPSTRGDLAVPPTSQPDAPPWHLLLSLAGQGVTGCVLAHQAWLRWVGALLTQEEGKTKHGVKPPHKKPIRVLTSPHGTVEGLGC